MAKKNEKKKADTPKEESFGELMSGKTSQRERNLALKAKLIESGELEETEPTGSTVKERNLAMKAKLEAEEDGKGEDE